MNVASSQQPNPTRPPQIPPQPAPQPVAAAAQTMNRQDSNEGRASPSVAGNDGPALPSTASWANKPAQPVQNRRGSAAPAPPLSVSPAPPASVLRQASDVAKEEPVDEAHEIEDVGTPSPLAQSSVPSNAPKQKKTRKSKAPELDRVLKVLSSTSEARLCFDASGFSEAENESIANYPPLFDPNGGAKRAALKEKLRQAQESIQPTLQAAPPTVETEDNPESGSLQLGGEPEERQDVEQNRSQQHAIAPPTLQGPGNQNFGLGLNDDLSNISMQARGLTPQQQQQALPKPGSNASNLLSAFQGGQMGQQPNQQSGTAPNHARQTSRFSFADSGNGATSVKSAANQKPGNQQASAMSANQFNQQSSMGNHFFSSGVQGPPPGLKATGTPPVSGGGMFGQGHGFATSGLGFGANAAARNANEEMMRDLLRGQRGGNIGGGQGGDAGKRESMFPFLNQYPSSTSTPAPAPSPGILNFPYGPQPGPYPEGGSQKQKKKGKKHRHANTSSSGGGGLVDVTDPNILQSRLHQGAGGMVGGQGLYASQGQGGFSNPMYTSGYRGW